MVKKDVRIKKLSELLINYSLNVKKGERILIIGNEIAREFIDEFENSIKLAGAVPVSVIFGKDFEYNLIKLGNIKKMEKLRDETLALAKTTQAVIDIENEDICLHGLSSKKIQSFSLILKPLWDYLVYDRHNYRRVTVLIPSKTVARDAKMSLEKFKDYFYSCCFVDWNNLSQKFKKITSIFNKGNRIHLTGEGIDLKFSVKNRIFVLEDGKENMPGGEIYTAPIKDSLNGWVKFDFPAVRDGIQISGISLVFRKGKIIKYSAEKNQNILKSLIETDKGSKYIGEFAVGINPKVNKVTSSWIDEKTADTIHLAIGKAYEENKGDNDSAVHFDIVRSMKHGKIIIDNKVIFENGNWLV